MTKPERRALEGYRQGLIDFKLPKHRVKLYHKLIRQNWNCSCVIFEILIAAADESLALETEQNQLKRLHKR